MSPIEPMRAGWQVERRLASFGGDTKGEAEETKGIAFTDALSP